MQKEDLIEARQFCIHHNVEFSFINSLQEFGLIEITTIEETPFIETSKLGQLERLMRLHYDLDINLEGIDAISYLLNRIENMHKEIVGLQNRLSRYEG